MSDEFDARCKEIVSAALAAWVGSLDEGIGLSVPNSTATPRQNARCRTP
jgi:hypothetical protein